MMIRMLVSMLVLGLAIALPNAEADEPPTNFLLKCTVVIDTPKSDPVTALAAVAFVGDYAVSAPLSDGSVDTADFKVGTVFNLKRGAWHYSEKRTWIDLETCRKWEAASTERSKQSLEKAPDAELRSFIESMISPDFEVTEKDNGRVVISNAHFTYEVTPDSNASPDQLARLLAYERLNAYQKAMTERKFPPTPTLAVNDVLAERKAFPAQMKASIWSPDGDVEITIDWSIESITPEVVAEVNDAIESAVRQPE